CQSSTKSVSPQLPSLSPITELLLFIEGPFDSFLSRGHDSSFLATAHHNASILAKVGPFQVCIVEKDLRLVGKKREPMLYFLHGVFEKVAGIDKEHVYLCLDVMLLAPEFKSPGKIDVITFFEYPISIGRYCRTILDIYANEL